LTKLANKTERLLISEKNLPPRHPPTPLITQTSPNFHPANRHSPINSQKRERPPAPLQQLLLLILIVLAVPFASAVTFNCRACITFYTGSAHACFRRVFLMLHPAHLLPANHGYSGNARPKNGICRKNAPFICGRASILGCPFKDNSL
jgi:hypothetical protein